MAWAVFSSMGNGKLVSNFWCRRDFIYAGRVKQLGSKLFLAPRLVLFVESLNRPSGDYYKNERNPPRMQLKQLFIFLKCAIGSMRPMQSECPSAFWRWSVWMSS